MVGLFFFVFGTAMGSFINVVALRFREDRFLFNRGSIGGRSHCPFCQKTLGWYELIPLISFVLQLGRCRSCGRRLSFQYPLVELTGGLLAFSVYYYFFMLRWLDFFPLHGGVVTALYCGVTALWCSVFFLFLLMAAIDSREYLIPDEISTFLFVLGCVWVFILWSYETIVPYSGSFLGAYASVFNFEPGVLAAHLLGAALGAGFIALIFFISRGKAIGFGDVKLMGAIGLLFGFPDIVLLTALSFILGALGSVVLLIRRTKGMKDFVPFAPFIALAAFLVFLAGKEIVAFYFSAFSF
jgi:prepilin signal peptidase PulO-like enzyme (type II secretory pathway)